MKPSIRVTPVPKEPPELERFVAALLAFVLERRAAEKAAEKEKEADG